MSCLDPPWIAFPQSGDMGPIWGGFRQGNGEEWLVHTWLPYWRRLSPEERARYLEAHPPPSEDWRLYVEKVWLGFGLV